MIAFDQILPQLGETLHRHRDQWAPLGEIIINRDLNGRVRLIVGASARDRADALRPLAGELADRLAPHAYGVDELVLVEEDMAVARAGATGFPLEGFPDVWVIDRLALESPWEEIAPVAQGAPRAAFYSIKGGVGRSMALAASAWALAQAGKRVLVLDLDLESPGLSSALLPMDRRPGFGITDWLIEDLVGNGGGVFHLGREKTVSW